VVILFGACGCGGMGFRICVTSYVSSDSRSKGRSWLVFRCGIEKNLTVVGMGIWSTIEGDFNRCRWLCKHTLSAPARM
jgi:hypothetical protein